MLHRPRVGWVLFSARGVVVAGLGLAGWLKVWDSLAHVHGGHLHSTVPQLRSPSIGIPIGIAEIAIAILMVTRWWRVASMAAFGTAAAFSLVLSYIVFAGLPTGICGCFGSWEAPVGAHFGYIFALLLSSYVLVSGEGDPATP